MTRYLVFPGTRWRFEIVSTRINLGVEDVSFRAHPEEINRAIADLAAVLGRPPRGSDLVVEVC